MKHVLAEKRRSSKVRRRLNFLEILGVGMLFSAALFAPRANGSIYTLGMGGNNNSPAAPGYPTGAYNVVSNYSFSFTATSSAGTIDATVTTKVISGDASNPYGGLTFEYLVMETGGDDVIDAMSAGGYAGFLTDVTYSPDQGGIAPSSFSRSPALNNGNTLTFNWASPNITPGFNSDEIVVQTDAHNFELGTGHVIDSEGAQVSILTPVPEPQIGSFAAMGIGALFVFLRRKSK